MKLFGGKKNKDDYIAILDVGSGSVLAAIVHVTTAEQEPTVIWAHREHTRLKKVSSINQGVKALLAALLNVSMKLDSEGRSALQEYDKNATLSTTQCTMAAPWSFTVTKTINIKQEEPIEISANLIDELVRTSVKQVSDELQEQEKTNDIGLQIITRSTMDVLCNGYRVENPEGEEAQSLKLTQATVVAQENIMTEIYEVISKLFPSTQVQATSFMLLLYSVIRSIHSEIDDVCLIDITDEASEVGIVRDGSLTYTTHTPFGIVSLAREIAEIADIPLSEALGHTKAASVKDLLDLFPKTKQSHLQKMVDAYVARLANLFNETGDSLSIPKKVFVHIEHTYAALFESFVLEATKKANNIDHTIVLLSEEASVIKLTKQLSDPVQKYQTDTALLLNTKFAQDRNNHASLLYTQEDV